MSVTKTTNIGNYQHNPTTSDESYIQNYIIYSQGIQAN